MLMPKPMEWDEDQDEEYDPANLRTLCAAILARAICDAKGKASVDHHIRREAIGWLKFKPKGDYLEPWSFPWVCQQIDVEYAPLQRILLADDLKDVEYRFYGHFDLNTFIRRMLDEDEYSFTKVGKPRNSH